MSQWNQFAFVPCSIVFSSPHLRKCFDRCNKAPLAWSQVNNGSWLMFSVSVTCSCSLIESALSNFFLPPLHSQYRSRCVCARSHSWPPPVSLHQPQHLPPNSPSSPLSFDTLSPWLPVCRLVLWHAGVHSIYISHLLLSCEYIYRYNLFPLEANFSTFLHLMSYMEICDILGLVKVIFFIRLHVEPTYITISIPLVWDWKTLLSIVSSIYMSQSAESSLLLRKVWEFFFQESILLEQETTA